MNAARESAQQLVGDGASGGRDRLDRQAVAPEHHAVADLGGEPLPPLGSIVRVVPNHACNAVNLVDEYTVLEGGRFVDHWAVAARAMNA